MTLFRLSILAILLLFFGIAGLALSRSTTFQLFGDIVARVNSNTKRIALTLDDGPSPKYIDLVLHTLAEKQVQATFFLVGQAVRDHPDVTRRIFEAGHEIGNHSFTHRRMVLMSQDTIASEIEQTDIAIRNAGYDRPMVFRPPYGKKLLGLPWYLSKTNRPTIMWDIAPEKWNGSIEDRVKRIVESARGGSIILLHIMYDHGQGSRDLLAPMIDALHEDGFEFVTISTLLAEHH